MAWDSDKPIAPFCVYKEGTIFYDRGERVWMETFVDYTTSESDIEKIYARGVVPLDELTNRHTSIEFRPFRNVELNLTYDGFERGRSAITFWWRDENGCRYPMFAAELDRLIKNGVISNKIGGLWSAEKRGQNYGIRLEKTFWRRAS